MTSLSPLIRILFRTAVSQLYLLIPLYILDIAVFLETTHAYSVCIYIYIVYVYNGKDLAVLYPWWCKH